MRANNLNVRKTYLAMVDALDEIEKALKKRGGEDQETINENGIPLLVESLYDQLDELKADRAALAAALRKAYEGGVRERWLMEGVKQLRLISSLIDVDDLTTQRYSREAMVAAKNLEGFSHPSLPADVAELLRRVEGRKEE